MPRQRSSAIVRAKAMMRHYGISVKAGMFRTAGSWEEVMEMNPLVGRLLEPVYEVWRLMVEQIKATEKVLMEKLPESDERMKLLMSIPGIGPVTAWTLIALAKKLLIISYSVWKRGVPFAGDRSEGMAA